LAIVWRLIFSLDQNGLASPEVDIGGRHVADALLISQVILVGDEVLDVGFEITWQVGVLEQIRFLSV
jgi:CBS-domain-containing membrane protein